MADWRYLAGIVDADGCIGIYTSKSSRTLTIRIVVANTSYALMRWIIKTFGGRLTTFKRRAPQHKLTYCWQVQRKETGRIVKRLLPYLIVKRRQGILALKALAHNKRHNYAGSRTPIPNKVLAFRENISSKCKKLNRGN